MPGALPEVNNLKEIFRRSYKIRPVFPKSSAGVVGALKTLRLLEVNIKG